MADVKRQAVNTKLINNVFDTADRLRTRRSQLELGIKICKKKGFPPEQIKRLELELEKVSSGLINIERHILDMPGTLSYHI